MGHENARLARSSVSSPKAAGLRELRLQQLHQGQRQHDDPILVAFATSDNHNVPVKIHIFDPQNQAFCQSHASAIKQSSQSTFNAFHQPKHRLHLWHRQNDRNTFALWWSANGLHPCQILSDDLLVEKQQSVQRLTVGGRRDLLFYWPAS
jgi:hypothetical protein